MKRFLETSHALETQQGNIPFLLKRSSKRRSLVFCVNEKAELIVYSPLHFPEPRLWLLLKQKSPWITRKIGQISQNRAVLKEKKFQDGHKFFFLGRKYPLTIHKGSTKRNKIDFDWIKWTIHIPEAKINLQSEVKKVLTQWYRRQAEELLRSRVAHYAGIMKVWPAKVIVRSQKRMWGNCYYHAKKIHFNWQIIMAPLDTVDYVVVHELCHLLIPSHSRMFWRKVREFFPCFEAQKEWLRKNSLDIMLPY